MQRGAGGREIVLRRQDEHAASGIADKDDPRRIHAAGEPAIHLAGIFDGRRERVLGSEPVIEIQYAGAGGGA